MTSYSQPNYDVVEATIRDLQNALASGQVTSRELVETYLQRIESYDQQGPKLKSILAINPKAIEEAKVLDEERKTKGVRGPLHGIPIVLKDNFGTYDMPTTGGSKALAGSIPLNDAFLTKKLREAGAVILAKANLHELARAGTTVSSLGGQTLNPYDLTRTPGGSSGGTGAAVAANMAAAGTGTDTVNSVRSPASANNLVGFRPTLGLLSRSGIIPAALTQDMAGPITRTVADAAIMLEAMVGYDPQDGATAWSIGQVPRTYRDSLKKEGLKGKRLGLLKTILGKDPEVLAVMEKAIAELKAQGAAVVEIDIPDLDTGKIFEECDVQLYESKSQINAYLSKLGPNAPIKTVADLIGSGILDSTIIKGLEATEALDNALDWPEYKQRLLNGVKVRDTVMRTMADYQLDAIVYPHQQVLVVRVGEDQIGRNGILASIAGFPAVTVPAGFSTPTKEAPLGVPVGIEFLGRPWTEPLLFEIAYAYEQVTHHRRPPKSTP